MVILSDIDYQKWTISVLKWTVINQSRWCKAYCKITSGFFQFKTSVSALIHLNLLQINAQLQVLANLKLPVVPIVCRYSPFITAMGESAVRIIGRSIPIMSLIVIIQAVQHCNLGFLETLHLLGIFNRFV